MSDDKEKRDIIFDDINTLRSGVGENPKIKLVVQKEIFEVLDNAAEELGKSSSVAKLNQVRSKINMVRKRALQAESQSRLLAFFEYIWLLAFIALSAWGIYEGEFWPKAAETGGREILFGAVLWGLVGATIDGFRELHTRLARHELDTNRLAWYLTHPLIGAGLGGILFLLVSAGLLVTGQEVGTYNPSLPLILAALAGFEQRDIIRYLRDTVKKILGIDEKVIDEGG